jgi:YaeC family lipoprotein
MIHLLQLLWIPLLETLLMVAVSTVLSAVGGAVVGVLLVTAAPDGVRPAPIVHRLLGFTVNIGRSLPFIILMVAITPLTRLLVGTAIGVTAAIVPLTIGMIPFVGRLVESALKEVPRGVIEAAKTMGATPWQIVRKVYLPEALPSLIRALTVVSVTLVDYSAMAGALGGGGLGDLAIRNGYQGFHPDVMVATVLIIIVLVQGLQRLGDAAARRSERGHIAVRRPRRLLLWSTAVAVLALAGGFAISYALHRAKPLRVGASAIPHGEILEFLRPELKRQGVDLKIVYMEDGPQMNSALVSGDLDANYFQHKPYLDRYNLDHNTHIVSLVNVHIEPIGLYPGRIHSMAALPDRGEIGIPNDTVNLGRALELLQSAGLIKLRPPTRASFTQQDIIENPRHLRIHELDGAELPRALFDLDAAVINTNYALLAKLNPVRDAPYLESSYSPYANLLAAMPEKANDPRLLKLVSALHSPQTRKFIIEKYKGAILPAF